MRFDEEGYYIPGTADAPPPAASSWDPIPEWWAGDGEAPPQFLRRQDGQPMLYAGKVNSLIAPSESGKSWLAILAVRQCLQRRQPVTYVDFESDGASVGHRLRQTGVPTESLALVNYLRPDEPWAGRGLGDPALIVVDGVNTFYGIHQVDYLDAIAVSLFNKRVLEPWADAGPCVCLIDQTPKNQVPGQGAGAIGSQAKRATLSGASLRLKVTHAFGRGRLGKSTVYVDKDRPGHVRGLQCDDESVGELIVDDRNGTTLTLGPSPWVSKELAQQDNETTWANRITRALEDGPLSGRALAEAIGCDRTTGSFKGNLEKLTLAGVVKAENGARNSVMYRLV